MEWTALIVLAILIEAIIANLKVIWSDKKFSISALITLIVSIAITCLTGADIFPLVDLPIAVPFIGSALTGIIVSRGANFVNDLWSKITGGK